MSKIRLLVFLVLALAQAGTGCDRPPTPAPIPLPSPTPSPTPPEPTLMAAKFVDQGEAAAGDVLQYTLVVMNDMLAGADPGAKVGLVDKLPEALELVPGSLSADATCDAAKRTIMWQGHVPSGLSVQVVFKAKLTAAPAGLASIVNTMSVTDAFGRVREVSAHTQVRRPTPTATSVPATPTPTATGVTPVASPSPVPSATELQWPHETVPYVKGLVITPDEPPVYYLVVGDALYRSSDRGARWGVETLQGLPPEALVSVAAVDYRNPQAMYLGTSNGLFRRESAQEAWRLVNTLQVTALAVDLQNSDVLWAGVAWTTAVRAVIVKSNDRGRTWSKADYGMQLGFPGTWVGAILIHPKNPNVIWAHVRPETRHDWPRGLVFRGGRDGTWEQLPLGAPFDFASGPDVWKNQDVCFVSGLAYDPNLNALYAGCDISYYNGESRTYRLLRSLNADAPNSMEVRWEVLAELGTAHGLSVNSVRPLAVDARQPKSLFVFMDVTREVGQPRFRLLVSDDDGKTWDDMPLKGLPGG